MDRDEYGIEVGFDGTPIAGLIPGIPNLSGFGTLLSDYENPDAGCISLISQPPSSNPSVFPTTAQPTQEPTNFPTMVPTSKPTVNPTKTPTSNPSSNPTATPTKTPTSGNSLGVAGSAFSSPLNRR